MSFLRRLSLLVVPFLGGCFVVDSQPSPINHSPGFFAEFDRMVTDTMVRGNADEKASIFVGEYTRRADDGPHLDEVYAAGPTWDKVQAFLDIGIVSAEVMASVNDTAHHRVDIFADASDRVLRSDYVAITSWNQSVSDKYTMQPTTEIVWESLYLVLVESAHAERSVATAKGEWIEGHWMRGADLHKNLWVNDYYESVWHDGTCHDDFVRSDCISTWIPEICTDVWIDDGYWDTTCSSYDSDGNCVEWTDTWVDTGYYETQCTAAYYAEECTDIYQTVCDAGQWQDIAIAAHAVDGVRIPGENTWIERRQVDVATEWKEALPEQEAAILALGIEYVASFGPNYVQPTCLKELDAARAAFNVEAPQDSIKISRNAILQCMSRH
jgi:hypothetical protein